MTASTYEPPTNYSVLALALRLDTPSTCQDLSLKTLAGWLVQKTTGQRVFPGRESASSPFYWTRSPCQGGEILLHHGPVRVCGVKERTGSGGRCQTWD